MRAATTRAAFLGSICLMAATLVSPLQGQTSDSRWLPFMGCWQPTGGAEEAGLLCFRPTSDGVEMFNVVDGETVSTERIATDGSRRAINADGCIGWESVTFSEDGLRAFTETEFSCEVGEPRSGTGVMSFIAPNRWIDVRSLVIEDEPVAWVQRYSLASAEAMAEQGIDDPADFDRTGIRAMRQRASRDIDVQDVEEAVRSVSAEAAKVWVATHESRFALDGGELVRLADAGVPEDVIDVMIATTYPERFMLTPDGVEFDDRMAARAARRGVPVGFRSFLWDPFYGPVGYYYGPYGYRSFGYYGYGPGLYGGGYYGYVPTRVIVRPAPSSTGRMINGQGYRRSSSGGTSSQGSAGPSSGGGSVSPAGASRGSSDDSSSGSGRRTAVRRGN